MLRDGLCTGVSKEFPCHDSQIGISTQGFTLSNAIAEQWNKTQYTAVLRKVIVSVQKRKSIKTCTTMSKGIMGNGESRLLDCRWLKLKVFQHDRRK